MSTLTQTKSDRRSSEHAAEEFAMTSPRGSAASFGDTPNEALVGQSNTSTAATALLPVTKSRQMLCLASAFFTICITIGLNQSYGQFQATYTSPQTTLLTSDASPNIALIAFVGTLGAGLTWAGSIVVNPLMARVKDVRYITCAGSLFMSLGLGLASLSTKVVHLLLTQGLLYGIGASMLYFPILTTAPEYFNAHRGLAMGIILSGAGIGAVVISPTVQALTRLYGIRTTLRAFGVAVFILSFPIACTVPPSRFPARRATHISLAIARKPAFLLSVAAALLQSAGNLIPLTYLADYSLALGYSAGLSAALISVNNGVNSVSRVVTGFAGDKLGRQNALVATVIGSAVAVIGLWLASVKYEDRGIWLAFVVVYGVWAGGYNSLYPTTVADVFGLEAYASINGFIYFIRGLGALFGSPVAGVLLGQQDMEETSLDRYAKVVYLDAALLFGASVCVAGVRYFDAREKGKFKLKA